MMIESLQNTCVVDFGKVFMISGPAGVGKTTVSCRLLEYYPKQLKKIITVTTRPPRLGEVNNVDYCFIDEATFLKYIAEDKFLEYTNVHGKHFYGTPIAALFSNIRHGIDSLLVVDMEGVANIRKRFQRLPFPMVSIFMMPENLNVLEDRLRMRDSESPYDLAQRLKSARHEIKLANNCDYIVLSGSREEDFVSMEMIYKMEQTPQEKAPLGLQFTYHASQLIPHH
jgi:guanylate kinase